MKKIDLPQEARGRECQTRIAGVCNYDDTTTILHHVRLNTGLCKPDDKLGAHTCSDCHAYIHASKPNRIAFLECRCDELEGMYRTIETLIREGKI